MSERRDGAVCQIFCNVHRPRYPQLYQRQPLRSRRLHTQGLNQCKTEAFENWDVDDDDDDDDHSDDVDDDDDDDDDDSSSSR